MEEPATPSEPPPLPPESGSGEGQAASVSVDPFAPMPLEPAQPPSENTPDQTVEGTLPASRLVQVASDPWAHRRGEPRVFAFLWTMYILIAVAGSVLWVSRFAAVSPDTFTPAARIMLVVIAVGATVLWPMVRLSQASPARDAFSHAVADTWVVLLPVQLVIWPLIVLASWPLMVVATVAATIMVWIVLTGGVLAIALGGRPLSDPRDGRLAWRSLWMAGMLAIVLGAPAGMLVCHAARRPAPEWLAMLSPLTAIPAVCGTGMSGPQNPVTALELRLVLCTGVAALAVWVVAGVRRLFGKRAEAA